MIIWLQFILCTAIILFAGTKLSKYGDVIAEKTGLSRTWIGVVLLASVTSLPELITGVSAVTIFELPNIAVGDVLGSCMFNILIIGLMDLRTRKSPITSQAHQGHVLTAGFGILLLGLVSTSIYAGANFPNLGWVGLYSFIFFVIYLGAMRMVFSYEKKRHATLITESDEIQYKHISKRKAYVMYSLNALLVIAAAGWLPHIGDEIAEITGLGNTFVGSIFIAFSTSLPEVVVSFAALRAGAVDLAMGNLFGSNLFNIGILAVHDVFYTKGPLLASVTGSHLISANAAIVMMTIAVIGLTYRADKKRFLAWDSVGIILVYGITTWLLFALR